MGVQQHIIGQDQSIAALVSGFGQGVGFRYEEHFRGCEDVDFHWQARVEERWIGAYESLDEEDGELDRVAILGRLDGRWFVATCIVDGEGRAQDITGKRQFLAFGAARTAFGDAR